MLEPTMKNKGGTPGRNTTGIQNASCNTSIGLSCNGKQHHPPVGKQQNTSATAKYNEQEV
jgi:hypothetical protein